MNLDELWSSAYNELLALARSRLRRSGPFTLLDTNGLISDTYMRMAKADVHPERLGDRRAFFTYCSRVMRSIVIDLVRENDSDRRGNNALKLTLATDLNADMADHHDPLSVDEAITELARLEPRLAQVVELRYFGGFTEQEVADILDMNVRTVRRDWKKACMLLRALLAPSD